MQRKTLREVGLRVGVLDTGPMNAITDVAGVRVGHISVREDAPRTVRSGVTAVLPLATSYLEHSVFAGFHSYNGFGEVTGSHWINETGLLTSPICLSSAFSVGALRDAILAHPFNNNIEERWHQPVAGETFDGVLNDGVHGAISATHVEQAIAVASGGALDQGNVGGGSGMMSFEFKSGIGTSSRRVHCPSGQFTVGVMVQSNFGNRSQFTVDGVPVGRHIGYDQVDSPQRRDAEVGGEGGSIVIVVATDAPLLPPQCARLARRAGIGLGRVGGFGNNRSGDFIVAFSTANRIPFCQDHIANGIRMLPNEHMNPLFQAAAEATEEAIVNSMTMAETMVGRGGVTVHALPLDTLVEIMTLYGRGAIGP